VTRDAQTLSHYEESGDVHFDAVYAGSAHTAVLGLMAVAPTHAPAPTHSPAANAQQAGLQPWLIAIFGALVAAVLAIATQFGTTLWQNHRDLSYVRASVESEIAAIDSLCRDRLGLPTGRMVVLSPFPMSAWNSFRLSPQRARIPKMLTDSWETFYRLVETANAEITMVPFFLQVAALATEPKTREDYLKEAIALSRKHLNEIVQALPGGPGSQAAQKPEAAR
jgi:hypothetical protein